MVIEGPQGLRIREVHGQWEAALFWPDVHREGREGGGLLDEDGVGDAVRAADFVEGEGHRVPADLGEMDAVDLGSGAGGRDATVEGPGVFGADELGARAGEGKGVVAVALGRRRGELWRGLVDEQVEVGRGQQALESSEGHLEQVVAGILELGTLDQGRGRVGREPIGTRPGVVGEGLGDGVVDEFGHLQGDVAAKAGGSDGLDEDGRADSSLDLEGVDGLHRAAVGVDESTLTVVVLWVAGNVAGAGDLGHPGQGAVALEQEAVVGQLDLETEGHAVHTERVIFEQSALPGIGSDAGPDADGLLVGQELPFVVALRIGHGSGEGAGQPEQRAGEVGRPQVEGLREFDIHGGVRAEVLAHDRVLEDVAGFGHPAVQVFDVDRGPEVGFVHIDGGGDGVQRDGLSSGRHPDGGVGGVVGEEVVAAVVGNEDVGVVSEGVVGRRNSEGIHGAPRAVGAVECVVDGVGGVGDVFEPAGAIEPELIAIRSPISVIGHHAELEVHRSQRRREEPGDVDVDGAVVAATAPARGDHGESVEDGEVAHGLQRIGVNQDEDPPAPGGIVLVGDDVGHGHPGVDGLLLHPVGDVREAAVVVDVGRIEFDFLIGLDVEIRLVIRRPDLDLVPEGFIGHEPVAEPSSPVEPGEADVGAEPQGQAVGGGAPRVGVVVPVVVDHVVVIVVVLGPIARGHGLLRLGAVVAAAAVHRAVGEKDDAAVLLRLVPDVERLHDLGLSHRRDEHHTEREGPR